MWVKCLKAGVIALTIAGISSCATVTPPPPPITFSPALRQADWPQKASSLNPQKDVVWGVLPNGLRYAILQNKTPKRSVALRLYIAAGSLDESDAQQGLAHFLEHMSFNGSKDVPEGEMVKILERYGLAFGADTNASTGFDRTVYKLDLPSNGDEIVDKGLLLLNETARNLTLAPDAIDRERGVIKSEERLRNTPEYRAIVASSEFVYPESRYARRMPIGKLEVIEKAQRDQFLELYKRTYRPDRTTMVIVGDVDPAKIAAKITARFGDWAAPALPVTMPSAGPVHATGLDAGYFFDPELRTSISLTFIKPPSAPEDTVEKRKTYMARGLANAIVSRRLRALSRQASAKILSGGAFFDDTFNTADVSTLVLNAEPKNWREALAVGEQELRRALTHGFTKAELAEQLAEMRASYKNAAEYAPTRKTAELAATLVSSAQDEEVFTHPADDLALFEAFAKTVTPASLSRVFKKDWAGVEPKIFLSTNAKVENPKEAILGIYKASRAKPVGKPEKGNSDAFAYTSFGAPGAVVERKEVGGLASDPNLKLIEVRFANNVRLNIFKTPYERDTVRAKVRICCGNLDLGDKPAGFPTYLEFVFPLGGLEKHSADDLERLNAGRTADFDIGIDEDAYLLNGVVTPADLEWQLQVWAAELTAPGYRPEAQAIFQKTIAVWLETLDATPESVLDRDLPSILRSGDPRWTIPDRGAFEVLKLDDARATLAKPLASGALEISLVGDVDEQKVIDLVAKTLGALPPRDLVAKPLGSVNSLRAPAFRDTKVLTHAGPKNQAASVVAWDAGDFQSDPVRGRKLRLLAAIFDLKLTDELRERLGDTYSPSVDVDQSEVFTGAGVLKATIDLEPDKLKVFYEELGQIVSTLAAGKISEDEFERAQRPIVEGLSKSEESNVYWQRVADEAQLRPQTLDWHRSRRQDYETATLAQMKALAKDVFKDPRGLRIEVRPAP